MGELYLQWIRLLEEFFLLSSDSRSLYLGVACYFFSVLVLRRGATQWKSQRLGMIAAFGIFFFDLIRFQMQKMQIPSELVRRELMTMFWNCLHGLVLPMALMAFSKWLKKDTRHAGQSTS